MMTQDQNQLVQLKTKPSETRWGRLKQRCKSVFGFTNESAASAPMPPENIAKNVVEKPKFSLDKVPPHLIDSDKVVGPGNQEDYKQSYSRFSIIYLKNGLENKLKDLTDSFSDITGSPGGDVKVGVFRSKYDVACTIVLTIEGFRLDTLDKAVLILKGAKEDIVLEGTRVSKENQSWIEYGFLFDVRRLNGIETIEAYARKVESTSSK